jgi:glycerol-3-phosphate dehydrogenase
MGQFSALTAGRFDAAIIGGGIIGAGVARDLAMRGLSVALVEKGDFGGGTTAGSTRLIHGGLRYLEMLDFGLVRMDLRERETLLRIAPHRVKPLEFRIPFAGHGWWFRQKLRAGLALYDLLSYDKSLPNHRWLGAKEASAEEPGLDGSKLDAAAAYYDAQVNLPERLCLENILDAEKHGAVVRNYCEVTGVRREEGRIGALEIRDTIDGSEGELRARVYVNATGAWFDGVHGRLSGAAGRRIRTTKGIHLLCAPMVRHANVLFSPVDGRLFFVLPLFGRTWIGTTDTDFRGDPGEARASEEDVEYLLRSVEPFFPGVRELEMYSTTAGVRALVRQEGSESSVSRMHRVEETPEGVIAVLGGKITGYRAIAEEAAEAVCAKLGHRAVCGTGLDPLPGAGSAPGNALGEIYGSLAEEIGALCDGPLLDASRELTAAEVIYCVRREHCRRASDFLFRRTAAAFSPDMGASAAKAVVDCMGEELGWPAPRREVELEDVRAWIHDAQLRGVPRAS